MEENKQSIVFAFWVNGTLKGFRQDTFNTIGMDWAKIYTYSPSQVETVLDGIKSGLNKTGTSLMKFLMGNEKYHFANTEADQVLEQMSSTEDEMRSWGEFEVRVHPFIDREEDYTYPEKWKIQAEINNLREAIETYRFKIIENEN
jgi:hypothetical protein